MRSCAKVKEWRKALEVEQILLELGRVIDVDINQYRNKRSQSRIHMLL